MLVLRQKQRSYPIDVTRSNRVSSNGFTLIETMITVALLGIIAAAGAPALNEFYDRQKVNVSAEAINLALSTARSTALNDLSEVRVCWNITTGTITRNGLDIPAGHLTVFKMDPVFLINNFTFNDSMHIVDTEGNDCITYTPQGNLDPAMTNGSSLRIALCKEIGVLTDSKLITVKHTGRAVTRPNEQSDGSALLSCG